jgi:hypothetical protein
LRDPHERASDGELGDIDGPLERDGDNFEPLVMLEDVIKLLAALRRVSPGILAHLCYVVVICRWEIVFFDEV